MAEYKLIPIHDITPEVRGIRIARKSYECQACYWLRKAGNWGWLTFSERRLVVKAKQNNWKIQPGQPYVYQFLAEGDDSWSFRAIPEIHELCLKYGCYPECTLMLGYRSEAGQRRLRGKHHRYRPYYQR